MGRPAQDAAGPHGVEQVGDGEAKIPVQDAQVILGAVKDFEDGRVGKQRPQARDILEGQGVDQIVGAWYGDLDQADLLLVDVEAV